jgi:2-C-methyl-D-erythritol 4-phosphate cytidylyltransferase
MVSKRIAILPCAGQGSRFGDNTPKQYTLINGKTILEHTINVFLSLPEIDQIIIVTAPDDTYIDNFVIPACCHCEACMAGRGNLTDIPAPSAVWHAGIQILKIGGSTRTQTVKNAINALDCNDDDWLLVHDVARCCITRDAILRQITLLKNDEVGGILAIRATDTIKQSNNAQVIDKTLDRSTIYQAQTPQMFRSGILKTALNKANLELVTDEASAVEQMGLAVKLVEGVRENIKITYPFDIKLAEVILSSRL